MGGYQNVGSRRLTQGREGSTPGIGGAHGSCGGPASQAGPRFHHLNTSRSATPRRLSAGSRVGFRADRLPFLMTFSSSAVRLAEVVRDLGVDLAGAYISMTGEPVTAPRLEAVRATGATTCVHYGAAETATIAVGCLAPEAPDDMHLLTDLHAVVAPPSGPSPDTPSPLFVSSLRRTARNILLNVSIGDCGVLRLRDCGCPLAGLGWNWHVHTVRSESRLTTGGMAMADSAVIRVLEEVLPDRFGGGPTDYQLVEEEDAGGAARLRLLVHPRLGPLEPQLVSSAFLEAVGQGDGVERITSLAWAEGEFLQVDRRPPETAASGKIRQVRRRPL